MRQKVRLPNPGSLGCWVLASRPKTLLAAAAPVLLGTALAFSDGEGSLWLAAAALLGAIFLQIGSNLVNDCADSLRGADTPTRLGPARATASGLLQPRTVAAGAAASFLLATFFGAILVLHAGWPIALIGLGAIVCGILYTAGPVPLAYFGLGDIFAFLFFGPVATAGTYFVQTGQLAAAPILAGCAPGFYAVALLTINNLRDRECDRKAGKRTLAVRLGSEFARAEIAFCILVPAVIPAFFPAFSGLPATLLSSFTILIALPVLVPVVRGTSGRSLNRLLGPAGMINVGYSIAFSIACLWPLVR